MTADPFVALAVASFTHYVKTGRELPLPARLPDELLTRRAGAFVSLHMDGGLRGCIGTISPSQPSLAMEIIRNAVSAAAFDPRFEPVTESELLRIRCSVDVLGEPEDVANISMLNPKAYGVIVSRGGRRGLLLPDLEGVDTAEFQVEIARRKAGIPPGIEVKLQRFRVVRHE